MKILVLNSGSSSQKIRLYEFSDSIPEHPPVPLWQGRVEWGRERKMEVSNAQGLALEADLPVGSQADAVGQLLNALSSGDASGVTSLSEIAAVGHRFVHGGSEFRDPVRITTSVRDSLRRLESFAPLHNRAELEGVEAIDERLADVPQIAVFDTAFHSQMPVSAFVYPGPYDWLGRGIRRYGFHGINHQYCAERTAQLLGKGLRSIRIVSCHLGSGCSLAAIQDGHSVDTTMGFTPLEGLMMSTRSGSVDPGILTYLLLQERLSPERLDEILNTKSGLLGISGISGDMRDIVSGMKRGHERAQLAFEIFVHCLMRGIGAMIAVLGGVDVLVFTAGIGENSPEVRAIACESLAYLQVKLDGQKNQVTNEDIEISTSESAVRTFVIHANEEWAIARECWRVLFKKGDIRPAIVRRAFDEGGQDLSRK